jgi:polyisoprenoid-binding protein YceI
VATLALLPGLVGALPADAAQAEYQLTPTHTFVHFEWAHAGLSTLRGRFDRASGRVTMDRAAGQGRGLIELRLDSVNTGRPVLDAALRQALGAEGEASARFDIDALQFSGGLPSMAIGRFSWRTLAQPVTLQADHFNCYLNPLFRREVCGGEFTAQVDPAALGLTLDPAFGLRGPIRLRVQVEAIRQDEGS